MNRDARIALADQTVRILAAGEYRTATGEVVSIADALARCVAETQVWWPEDFPEQPAETRRTARTLAVEVTGETTLAAAWRVSAELDTDREALALIFASARKPGGGFRSGAPAQEETLTRASGLYASLARQEAVYAYQRRFGTALYADCMIYSPHVPVFRDDAGTLLEVPYLASFLSSPAVNAKAVRRNEPGRVEAIEPTLERRLRRLLWVAWTKGHDTLVLGAWGCGVFGNDPGNVAGLYRRLLGPSGPCHGWFHRIVYAIYDPGPGQPTLQAFHERLTQGRHADAAGAPDLPRT